MEVVFGDKNLVMTAGKTKNGEYVVKLQRISITATPDILENEEWKKYINNSPCILTFKTLEGLRQFIRLLKYLKQIMIEDFIKEMEGE